MTYQTDEFHPHAAKRLFLAVVNQAIFDGLENNEEAKAAEQWLLNEGLDNDSELLSGAGECGRGSGSAFRCGLQRWPGLAFHTSESPARENRCRGFLYRRAPRVSSGVPARCPRNGLLLRHGHP